jgi:ribosomal protein S18 acetylase RimI-like enzyme
MIREFSQEMDQAALQNINTAFSSDYVYAVTVQEHATVLDYVRHDPPSRKAFAIELQEGGVECGLVAIIEDQIRGFIAARFERWNKQLKIQHFYVDEAYRGNGIGRALMDSLLRHARSTGAVTVWTETSNLNYPGIEVYKRLGFSICGFDLSMYKGTPNSDEFAVFLSCGT